MVKVAFVVEGPQKSLLVYHAYFSLGWDKTHVSI